MSRNTRRREIARQDVIITPEGPVELYRRDTNGNEKALSMEQVSRLSRNVRSAPLAGRRKPRAELEPSQISFKNPILSAYDRTRTHLNVSGDRIVHRNLTRSFILHRPPFDWYDSNQGIVLDEIEEVIPVPGTLDRPHVRPVYGLPYFNKAEKPYNNINEYEVEYEDDEDDFYEEEEVEVVRKNPTKQRVRYEEDEEDNLSEGGCNQRQASPQKCSSSAKLNRSSALQRPSQTKYSISTGNSSRPDDLVKQIVVDIRNLSADDE